MRAGHRAARARRRASACWLCLAWLFAVAPLHAAAGAAVPLPDEDGYALWLRYAPLSGPAADAWRARATALLAPSATATQRATLNELRRGLSGLLGQASNAVEASAPDAGPRADGAVVLGTPASSPLVARLARGLDLARLGREGFVVRETRIDGHAATVIAGNDDTGVLYGAFAWLRSIQNGASDARVDLRESPKLALRVLDHWDDLDGHVERGYAGASIWDWHKLPDWIDPRYTDYARANASVGINGAVLNNVNAKAISLTAPYIAKAAAIAGALRPWGMRVYLSARFSAPIEIGGLPTADPLDPRVAAWWKAKADEIYRAIPDFGGFLVKANSEGQPGPQDYGRSHADGANMLADALAAHGGAVMWRAFVYSHEQPDDRARQAYDEFVPLDGRFRDNVLVQVKNGAIDFQPREPFHPLFGAMPKTPLMMEFQITKEYLGFATHLVYLGPLFEETLSADTHAAGAGSTVAKVVEGRLTTPGADGRARLTGMAGVANIGADRNWTGSHFDQANWYAFGRMAWDPSLPARTVAGEWTRMTWSRDGAVADAIVAMMMGSREAAVDYMTPLGLHHLMGRAHHYGPGPWVSGGPRADWTSVYYHRADADGIGFDRSARGSNAVAQYAPPVAREFGDPRRVPERYLLWFHHVPWDHRMASGRTLWGELVAHYRRGIDGVAGMRRSWDTLAAAIDPARHAQVAAFLAIQQKEAQWWRDASIAYFQTFSKRPLPAGEPPPAQPLSYYEGLEFPYAPGDSH